MEIQSEILGPIVALAVWTMVMWLWMYVTRIPAMGKVEGLDVGNKVGGIGGDLDGVMPDKVQWVAHNYNHLLGEPTIFYAISFVLAITGTGDGLNATLAWVYVGLRILHSLIQALWNRVMARFMVFALSSIILIALTVHAAMVVF